MNTVLINADDFGLHPDIDRGIVDCIDAGVVQSISFSPQGESLNWDTLRELRARGIRCGLHVTLVGEPWLTDGRVVSGWQELVKTLASPASAGRDMRLAVEREVDAQAARCDQHNLAVSHIDSHQHVHAFPGVWQPVLKAARRLGNVRVRVPKCPTLKIIKKTVGGIALQMLSSRLGQRVGRFLPIMGVANAGNNTLEIFQREFAAVRDIDVELCVHPGVNSPSLELKYVNWNFDWTAERDALLDPRFAQLIAERGYVFAPLLPQSATPEPVSSRS